MALFFLKKTNNKLKNTNQKNKKTEVKYLKEKRDREAIEIESLNQSVEYYRRLNALTVPILMKSQNSQGAMHLKKEEWDIIVQNTDACSILQTSVFCVLQISPLPTFNASQ